ncbi:MAG: GTPase HflX [Alphaproteobacteria bacterium]|nr:GTPase HflX [Alphaproteobacteria bacterium]
MHPNVKHSPKRRGGPDSDVPANPRSPEARLEEIVGLASAIHLDIVASEVAPVPQLKPGTYLGKGAIERLDAVIKAHDIGVIIMDAHLSPVQQRNLEREWKAKVLDRTGVILEIFGERARTREGRLQVDLAHLTYQRSRLVRSWTHLERQRGGAGFMGGPGETQIEMDRRLIDQRIIKLKKALKEVKRTRELHREARRKVPYPIVALVGYTNAGKSTLFNRLTAADVFAKDQLFATLDPTMRNLELPSGNHVILSDTVGFISDLPHELVEAFHATLEEVLEAQIIVHVRDMAHPDTEAQKQDVETVLAELGLGAEYLYANMIEVRNKCDLLTLDEKDVQLNQARRSDRPIVVTSAVTGEGIDAFFAAVDARLAKTMETHEFTVKPSDGKRLAWLYANGEVLERTDGDNAIHLIVRMDPSNVSRFERL